MTNTRDRIVESARELFWVQGYHATSLKAVLTRADVGSGSLYHFFESKEELLEAVLRSYLELLDEAILQPAFAQSTDPIERIFLILDGYRTGLVQSGFRFACPIGRLALEMSGGPDRIRALVHENFEQWCAAIEACLEDAGDRLIDGVDRTALAKFVLTTMEGAVMQSDAARGIEPFDLSVEQLRRHIDAFRSPAATAAANP